MFTLMDFLVIPLLSVTLGIANRSKCVVGFPSILNALDRSFFCNIEFLIFAMKKVIGPIRRASIYGFISYFGLVLINNSSLDLPSLWIAYLPMFIIVYALTQWIDRRLG